MPDYHPPLPVGMEQKTQFEDYTVEVRNRFKGLDLIDRVPDELWKEVRDIVQETGIKTIPKKIDRVVHLPNKQKRTNKN